MKKLLLFLLFATISSYGQISLQKLKTENLKEPTGIGTQNPRFSWQLTTTAPNTLQAAYEVEVKEGKTVVWASGKVNSRQSVFINYKGAPLKSNTLYNWQVRVWDNHNQISQWHYSSFQTGIKADEIKAQWINSGFKNDTVNGIVPMFRKAFSTKKKISNATVYATARGAYELRINGYRVGDSYLAPGWTSYNHHLQIQAYDVTPLLNTGKNTLGALLGSGWYRTRLAWANQQNIYGKETALLFQMEVNYTDGSKETIISDKTWKAAESDILYSEIYNGETIDAKKRIPDWSTAQFDDSKWSNVVIKDFPKDYLSMAINESIKKHQTFKPKLINTPNGSKILDFGQNMVGWISANLTGNAGQKVTLSHFEMLDKFGNPYFDNNRTAKAQANYILSGKGIDSFEPHFTFFGFRYAKVEGIDINPDNFTGQVLYSDMEETGNFECSNPLVNQLQKNIQWGQKGNFLDVPTDCPQRDERLGWTGDAEVFSRTAAYNFNVNQFFAKWLKDVAADQGENGAVSHVVPDVLQVMNQGNPPAQAAGWGDAGMIIPYNMFVSYGDKKILEDQYPSMKKSIEYIRNVAKNDLWNTGFQFADWLSYRVDDSHGMIGQKSAVTDNYLVAQCFYAYNAQIMANTAKILGKTADAKDFEALLERIKKQFQKEYMTASGRLISETQTAYILALQFDMLPENLRPQAVERLVSNIKSYDYHLTTGFLGTPFLNPVLSRFNQHEVAYKLLLQDTYPSWLYPIKAHGATTIWERWDSMKTDSTFQDPSMTSFNHYAYGAIGDWIYRNVAGIDTKDFDGAGYQTILIKPVPGGNLTYAKGSLKTNYGLVSTSWKITENAMTLDVEIPANTTAVIHFPTKNKESITLDTNKVNLNSDGLLNLGSGKYSFRFEI